MKDSKNDIRTSSTRSNETLAAQTTLSSAMQPVITEIYSDSGRTIGAVLPGTSIDDATPRFTGRAEPGSLVEIFSWGVKLGEGYANDDGIFSFTTTTPFQAGGQLISVKSTQANGEVSDRAYYDLTYIAIRHPLDAAQPVNQDPVLSKPVIEGAYDNRNGEVLIEGRYTEDTTPLLKGTADPLAMLYVKNRIGQVVGSMQANSEGKWELEVQSTIGSSWVVVAVDPNDPSSVSYASEEIDIRIGVEPPPPLPTPDIWSVYDNEDIGSRLNSGDTTDDTTPTFSGGAYARGMTIIVRNHGKEIGQTEVNSDGEWSWTPASALEAGSYSLTFEVVDNDGNVHASEPFILEVVIPVVAQILYADDNVGDVTDPLNTGDRTDDETPTLHGSANPNSLVKIYYKGYYYLGSAESNANGEWSFTPSNKLPAGIHNFFAREVNEHGTELAKSPEFTLEIVPVIEYTAPTVSNVFDNVLTQKYLNNGSITDDTTPRFSGRGTPNSTLEVRDNDKVIAEVQVNSSGNWSWTSTQGLEPGEHRFSFVTVGEDGREYASADFNLEIITQLAGRIDSAGDNVGAVTDPLISGSRTDDTTPTLNGAGTPGGIARIYDNNRLIGSAKINESGEWSFTPSSALAAGAHNFYAKVTGPDGTVLANSPAFSLTIVPPVEYTAPTVSNVFDNVLTQKYLSNGSITDDTTPRFSGRGTPNSTIEVRDNGTFITEVQVNSSGNWSWTANQPLKPGEHRFSFVTVGEDGGEYASADFNLEIITQLAGRIDSAGDNVGAVTDPLISGSRTDDTTPTLNGAGTPGGIARIYDNNRLIGSAKINESGEWSFTPSSALAAGAHNFYAKVTGPDGTVLANSPTFSLTIAPPVSYTAPTVSNVYDNVLTQKYLSSGSITDDTTPRFSGRGTPNSTLEVRDNGTFITEVQVNSSGNWSWTANQPLKPGEHRFSFVTVGEDGGEYASADFNLEIISHVAGRIDIAEDNVGRVTDPLIHGSKTDDITPTLKGVGTPNGTVEIYDGWRYFGSAKINAEGEWSFTPHDLQDGSYSFRATVTSPDGTKLAQSAAFDLTIAKPVDYYAPSVSGVEDNVGRDSYISRGGITDDDTPTFSGRGVRNSLLEVRIDGKTMHTVEVNEAGRWSWTPSPALKPGSYDFTFVSVDDSGTEFTSEAISLEIITQTIGSIVSADDNVGSETTSLIDGSRTDDSQPTLRGTGTANGTVEIFYKNQLLGHADINEKGEWHYTPQSPLSNGSHEFYAVVTGPDGTRLDAGPIFNLTIDAEVVYFAPVIDGAASNVHGLTMLYNGDATDDATPHFVGTGLADSTLAVYINDKYYGDAKVDQWGAWSYTPSPALKKGEHTFSFVTVDDKGDEYRSETFTLHIDPAIPLAILSADDDVGAVTDPLLTGSTTDDTQPTLRGTGMPGSIIEIFGTGGVFGKETVGPDGNWSWTPDKPLSAGDYEFIGITRNSSGFELERTNWFELTITAPEADRSLNMRSLLQDGDAPLFAETEADLRTTQPVEPTAFVPASGSLTEEWENTPNHY
ncbi:Ig-like domain repeat protein [Duffyella gerundensis]|uniref:Ig-like domain-containing protein n=1 Tax=Duffyella gerundensis TaxID=1619313 RepID=UPI001CE3A88D|nr:Ig-like domain-containing protein [Duffyella gerundensis]UCB32576.1 Ig-like domain repeat protein [Duffyella gerundensis]